MSAPKFVTLNETFKSVEQNTTLAVNSGSPKDSLAIVANLPAEHNLPEEQRARLSQFCHLNVHLNSLAMQLSSTFDLPAEEKFSGGEACAKQILQFPHHKCAREKSDHDNSDYSERHCLKELDLKQSAPMHALTYSGLSSLLASSSLVQSSMASSPMKILIINLDFENQRMAFQKTQMRRLGLNYERISAIKPQNIDPAEMASKSAQWERPMRESEVACLYSHRTAWQMVSQANEPVLILEDDALLSSNVSGILQSLKKRTDLHHVTLEVRGRKKLLGEKPQILNENASLTRLFQDRTGAAAYVLWPYGAKILLEKSDNAASLADGIIAAAYELSSWQIEPAAAMQLDQCVSYGLRCPLSTASSITPDCGRHPTANNAISSLQFKWRRISSQIRMGWRQLSKITMAHRRVVAIEPRDFHHQPLNQFVVPNAQFRLDNFSSANRRSNFDRRSKKPLPQDDLPIAV